MDLRIVFGTFVLVFFAELGDKTQLSTMGKAAEGGRLSVFLGASAALVCSTLLAVALGDALNRWVHPSVIKLVGGLIFLVFGALMLIGAYQARQEKAVSMVEEEVGGFHPGAFARFVLNQALAFEEAAIDDYRRLAEKAPAGDVRDLLIALAAEEEAHLAELRRLGTVTPPAAEPFPYEPELPGPEALIPDVSSEARELLEHAVEHELATAAFYAALAESTHITSLRRALNALAAEERAHAERLRALA